MLKLFFGFPFPVIFAEQVIGADAPQSAMPMESAL